MSEALVQVRLDLQPNEASGLLPVEDDALLAAHGWDEGYWVVLDEGSIADCLAVVGHGAGAGLESGWEIQRLHLRVHGEDRKVEDAEALARWDGWVYVLGSQFGSKVGPLQPKRAFVARMREADVAHVTDPPPVRLDVVRTDFGLHRLLNDALATSGLDLVAVTPEVRDAFILGTRERERTRGRAELADRILDTDHPINVEGSSFRPDGSLLVGLRYPTARDGRPLLAQLRGIERLFDGTGMPDVEGFWVLDAVGREGTMAGVRDLTSDGEILHVVTGNVDSRQGGSLLIDSYPEGAATVSTHWRVHLPDGPPGPVAAERVREFPDLPRVEGIACRPGDRFLYVSDEDEGVEVRLTPLVTG